MGVFRHSKIEMAHGDTTVGSTPNTSVSKAEEALNAVDNAIANAKGIKQSLLNAGKADDAAKVERKIQEMERLRDEGRSALSYAKLKQTEGAAAASELSRKANTIDAVEGSAGFATKLDDINDSARLAGRASRSASSASSGSSLIGYKAKEISRVGSSVGDTARAAGLTDEAAGFSTSLDNVRTAGAAAEDTAKTAYDAANSLHGRNAITLRHTGWARPPSQCFTANTPVVMADGTRKPIAQIKVGDMVLSRDAASGVTAAKRVSHTFVHRGEATLNLPLTNGERIETTSEHPFYVQGRGWTPADEMGLGTSIVTRAGPNLALNGAVPMAHSHAPVELYNFTVEEFHSYFVGHSALWVHNAGEDGICALFSNQATAGLVRDYHEGVLIQGLDGQLYPYGASVKNLDLSNKTATDIEQMLTATGSKWKFKQSYIGQTEFGEQYPHNIYYHPDGCMVRVKPNGDLFVAKIITKRKEPHGTKAVLKYPFNEMEPRKPSTEFSDEAFKVSKGDKAIPKYPKPDEYKYGDEFKAPDGPNVLDENGNLTKEAEDASNPAMDEAHFDVIRE